MYKIKQNKKRQNDENIINHKFRSLFSSENLRITCYIIPYLTYKEVISLSKVNKSFHKTIRSHKVIKSYIIKSKLQPESRLLFYSTNLNLSSIKLTIEQELSEYKIKDNYYQKILSLVKNMSKI